MNTKNNKMNIETPRDQKTNNKQHTISTTLRIALIGAGNVATHLGKALSNAGCKIIQVYSRTESAASALASSLNTTFTTNITGITPNADLYLVMLKDSVLNEVLPSLTKQNPSALFVHTAGSVPMQIWEGLATRYGVLYPMQTFSKAQPVDFELVHFFVEANSTEDAELLKELASLISSKVFEASSEQRKYLHLSAVFACNFTNHMYAICEHLLTEHGLPFSSMYPLIDETARKVHHLSPVDGQTGPAQRYDTNIMQQQEALLANEPILADIYRLLSNNIHNYALQKEKEKEEPNANQG